MRPRLLGLAAPLLLAAGLAIPVATAAPAAAAPSPTGPYQMYGTSCGNSPCGMRFTATSNPNNAAYRAVTVCSNGTNSVGGWKTGTGSQSATGQCGGSSEAEFGEVEWNMQQLNIKVCYSRPGSWSGSC